MLFSTRTSRGPVFWMLVPVDFTCTRGPPAKHLTVFYGTRLCGAGLNKIVYNSTVSLQVNACRIVFPPSCVCVSILVHDQRLAAWMGGERAREAQNRPVREGRAPILALEAVMAVQATATAALATTIHCQLVAHRTQICSTLRSFEAVLLPLPLCPLLCSCAAPPKQTTSK